MIFCLNRLATLDEGTLRWSQLKLLDMTRNPLDCDCRIRFLKHVTGLVDGSRCALPAKLRGLELHHVNEVEFVCLVHQALSSGLKAFVIMFGAIILFFMVLGFVLVIKRESVVRWWADKKRGTGSIYYVKANSHAHDSQLEF